MVVRDSRLLIVKSPIYLPSPATKLRHVRDSDLAAIALEDYSVLVFDCEALRVVRRFGLPDQTSPHSSLAIPSSPLRRATLALLRTCRSVQVVGVYLTSSLDNTIRVWDVPTATCIDWMRFSTAPTSVTLSPLGSTWQRHTPARSVLVSGATGVSFRRSIWMVDASYQSRREWMILFLSPKTMSPRKQGGKLSAAFSLDSGDERWDRCQDQRGRR